MTRRESVVLAGLSAVFATAAALVSVENGLVNAAIAVSAIGMAWLAARALGPLTGKRASLLGGACLIAASIALVSYQSIERACTATNGAGRRVVIGTTLTGDGQQYKIDNPGADNDEILESLAGLGVELAWTRESIDRCRTRLAISGAVSVPLFGVAAVLAMLGSRGGPSATAARRSGNRRVFLSYTHDDRAAATRLKDVLVRHDIDVLIDTDTMNPGEGISAFIDRSIRDCDVVVTLISSSSLLSTWTASETVAGLGRNRWGREVALIACYLDEEWLRPDFRLTCTRQIDARLQQLDELLAEYAAKKIDSADLSDEQTRLYSLRNSLGTILAALKGSLCLDIRDPQFDASATRLVATIRKVAT